MEGNPFTPEEENVLKMIILVVGSVSLFLSSFVVITLSIFKEKRKYPAWSLNSAFVLSVAMIELLLVLGAAIGFHNFQDEEGKPSMFCEAQAILFVFFGSCMVWFWFFITINLFLRMLYNYDFNHLLLVGVGFAFSGIMTLPPAIVEDGVGGAGAWCFINSENWKLLYFDYYAIMGICCIIGLFLWIAIMYKLYRSGRILSQFISPMKSTEDAHIQANLAEKRQLFFRQLAFVTVFEAMFIIFFVTRIETSIANDDSDSDFFGWLFHTIMMSTLGIYTFFIFGLKRQNFALWLAACCQTKETTQLSSFVGRAQYDQIE